MSTLNQLKHGFNRFLDNLAEGWHEFSDRASHALTRFTPRHGGTDLDKTSDEFLRSVPRWGLLPAEMSESDDSLIISLEIPGIEATDFDIEVVDDYLVIRGEKGIGRSRREGRYHLTECAYGAFERALPLPIPVDSAQSTAEYKRGVLRVVMPKSRAHKTRRVEVQSA